MFEGKDDDSNPWLFKEKVYTLLQHGREENKEQKNEKEYVGKRQNKDIEKDIRTEDNFEV